MELVPRSLDHDQLITDILSNIEKPDHWLVLLKDDDEYIGFIYTTIDRGKWLHLGLINELYVVPAMRGRGHGHALVNHIIPILQAEKTEGAWLRAFPGKENFWRSTGFRETGEYDNNQKVMALSFDTDREITIRMKNRILLISGPHANESCSPLFADKTYKRLLELGAPVDIITVPYECTLLANLDDPENSIPDYCIPKTPGMLDMDLDGLIGEDIIQKEYPESLTFEFHNARTLYSRIDPDKPIKDYQIGEHVQGMSADDFKYEIAWWQNRMGGISGKKIIEMPVVQKAVSQDRIDKRMRRIEVLSGRGYTIKEREIDLYFKHEVDNDESERRGLLSDEIINKLAAWMLSVPDLTKTTKVS